MPEGNTVAPRKHVLIADDQAENLLILENCLSDNYTVHSVTNGRLLLDHLESRKPADLILLDIVMPIMDGFEALRRIKADAAIAEIPVLVISSLDSSVDETQALRLGAADFIHKPFSPPVVLARIFNHLQFAEARRSLKIRNEELEAIVQERTREIVRQANLAISAQSATITAFCTLAEARDDDTGNHIVRTQHYVKALAERLCDHPRFRTALSAATIELLYRSAPLHDVGKVAIPDAILNKPGKLTPEEWVIMKRHAEFGGNVIAQTERELGAEDESFLRYAREIAYHHHEKWDGSGYPQGLAGEAIPVSARLMAIADVYDALISRRVYKPAYPHEHAMHIISDGRGRHFDPDMTDAFIEISDDIRAIANRFRDHLDATSEKEMQ